MAYTDPKLRKVRHRKPKTADVFKIKLDKKSQYIADEIETVLFSREQGEPLSPRIAYFPGVEVGMFNVRVLMETEPEDWAVYRINLEVTLPGGIPYIPNSNVLNKYVEPDLGTLQIAEGHDMETRLTQRELIAIKSIIMELENISDAYTGPSAEFWEGIEPVPKPDTTIAEVEPRVIEMPRPEIIPERPETPAARARREKKEAEMMAEFQQAEQE